MPALCQSFQDLEFLLTDSLSAGTIQFEVCIWPSDVLLACFKPSGIQPSPVAQWLEQLMQHLKVLGSNPAGSSLFSAGS